MGTFSTPSQGRSTMETNFIFAGFGGQGVLLAGTVLANAFMLEGKNVTWYPCYGAEMRGGTVNCEIVTSDEDVSDCVKRGICKVNFATELRAAYTKAVKELLAEKPDTIDPKAYGKVGIQAVKELVMARMKVCGCDGKAE